MEPGSRIPLWLAAAVSIALAFGAGVGVSVYLSDSAQTIPDGVLWPDPPAVAPFNLMRHDGQLFTRAALEGRWSLLFFGFTHCPDVCPTTLAAMARAATDLRDHTSFAERGQVIFVSVDPARDDADTVHAYTSYFDPSFIGVTGGEAELQALTRSVGALFMRVEQPGTDNGYTMDHSAGIFIVSPAAEVVSVVTPPHSAQEIVQRFTVASAFVAQQP